MLSLETYRARFGPIAVSVLALAAAAGALLVLLPEQWQRIIVAAVAWTAGLAIAIYLARRATAREKARVAELETAEARHRALLDGLPLVTWMTAPGNRAETLYVGPGIADLSGYSPTEWAEQPDLHERLLHPDDKERVLHELEEAGDTPTSIDYRLLARDGRAVWVREDSATVRDLSGEPVYVQTFLRDIGDLKRGEDRRELLEVAEREAASESAERRSRLDLLRRVGGDIAASAELDGALGRVADLVVVDLADWCVIDVVDESNELRRVAAARGALIKPNGARSPAKQDSNDSRCSAASALRNASSSASGSRAVANCPGMKGFRGL